MRLPELMQFVTARKIGRIRLSVALRIRLPANSSVSGQIPGQEVRRCSSGIALRFKRSFVSPQRACVGKEQRVVPEVWADFAEIGCG